MTTNNLEAFERLIDGEDLRLGVEPDVLPPARRPARADALFHLPLLALSILVIAKVDLLRTEELGRRIAHLLIEHFKILRDVRTLEWSITLRRRCAEALSCLETAGLVNVDGAEIRNVTLTARGKEVLARGLRDESDVGQLARGLVRAHSRASLRRGST